VIHAVGPNYNDVDDWGVDVRCAFLTMDSAVSGLASSGCGCCAVRVFDRKLHSRMC
jgi:hypothetical protein